MVYTDNPFVDILVYYTKIMAINCVVKNETTAINNETINSVKNSDLYIACIEGRATFDYFQVIPKNILIASGIPEGLIEDCLNNKDNIPLSKRDLVTKNMVKYTIDTYIELNNYYRMLNGKPNIDTKGLKLSPDEIPTGVVIDISKYVHEMSTNEGQILTEFGIIDNYITDDPATNYLKYIGDNRINIYEARLAQNFQLLYTPTIEMEEIYDKFKDKYELNRQVTIKTIYSEAFKFESDYYDNFIIIFIVIQTMMDIIAEVQEMIARKDVFDSRTIRYIFESYGIPYYSDIPIKYQVAMIKNVNTLLKYKSTSKNMVDICSLFGFNNITVFKYYLLRDRKMHEDGSFFNYTKEEIDADGNTKIVEDNDKNYDLKFVKVPIQEKADNYIKNKENFTDYDSITLSDMYWDGELDHAQVKSDIINKQFSYEYSKYISINNAYSLANMSFDISYFFNMIYDNVKLEELLTVKVPYLSQTAEFKLANIFCFLFSASYMYNDIEDTIMDTSTKVMSIKGFNFKADLGKLSNYLNEKGLTLELAGIAGFQIPESSILTYKQLLAIFTNNRKIYKHVTRQMYLADSKEIYDIYKTIYDSLMIIEYTNEFFRLPNGEIAKTFTEYLQYNDSILYFTLSKFNNITNKEDKQKSIIDTINNVVYALDEYIDMSEYNAIYSFIPSVSSEYIKQYITKIINFFKSYKVDLMGISTIFLFDDKFENSIKPIDCMHMSSVFNKDDYYYLTEKIKYNVDISKSEKISIIEKIYFDISRWVELNHSTTLEYYEKIAEMMASFFMTDTLGITDKLHFNAYIEYKEYVSLLCKKSYIATVEYQTRYVITDDIKMLMSINLNDIFTTIENLKFNLTMYKSDSIRITDALELFNSTLSFKESMSPLEKISISVY